MGAETRARHCYCAHKLRLWVAVHTHRSCGCSPPTTAAAAAELIQSPPGCPLLFVQEEIEKVKKRREQREAERAAMAEELELIQRERAIAEAAELEKKEEEVGGWLAVAERGGGCNPNWTADKQTAL